MTIARGEIWFADFGEPVGHEQGYPRPALVISGDDLNFSRLGLAIAVPLTRRNRGWNTHVRIDPDGTGLAAESWAMVEQVKSLSHDRFEFRIGRVSAKVLDEVITRLMEMF